MPISLTGRLKALDTCAVSDALDFLGITGATTGIHSMWGRQKIAGRARTVEAVDAAAGPAGRHLGTQTVASAARPWRHSVPGRAILLDRLHSAIWRLFYSTHR